MSLMDVYLVTKNAGKLMAAQNAFNGMEIKLLPVDKDYPEIQADSSLEIARYTACAAAKDFNKPAIREDHSLFLNAFGIPGPYMNYFEKKMPANKILELLSTHTDRTGYFEVATVYAEPSGETLECTFQVPFTMAFEERGDLQKGWNRILILDNETRTLAEYPETERLHIWNRNYKKIAEQLEARLQTA